MPVSVPVSSGYEKGGTSSHRVLLRVSGLAIGQAIVDAALTVFDGAALVGPQVDLLVVTRSMLLSSWEKAEDVP